MCMQEVVEAFLREIADFQKSLQDVFDGIVAIYECCAVKKSNSTRKRLYGRSCVYRAALRIDLLPYYASGFL